MRSRRTPIVGARALAPARIGEIAVAVGESPGHLAVGPGRDRRRAGQRDAGDVDRRIAGDAQARRIPHGRHAEIEMHVIGDQRHTRARVHAGHRPVVAAGRRRPRRAGLSAAPAKRSCAGKDCVSTARESVQAACTHGRFGGVVRRVPVGVAGVDEGDERRARAGVAARGRGARSRRRRSISSRSVPYCSCHHIECTTSTESSGSHARGLRAQQQVFPGPRVQASEACVARRARTPR